IPLGCGLSLSDIMRTAPQRTATRRRARPPWPRSPGAGGGSRRLALGKSRQSSPAENAANAKLRRNPSGGDGGGARCCEPPIVVAPARAHGRRLVADVLADPRTRKRERRTDLAVKQAFYRLADEKHETILVACSKCDWRAAFSRDDLIASHGADSA